MASPDDESAPNIQEKKRGVTVMKEVARARSRGVKLEVGWNKRGQPIEPNCSKLVGYIGVVVRQMVPITCDHWRDKALDDLKKNIWADIESSFVVDESRRRFILMEAGKLHRQFRAHLTRRFLRDADGNVNEHPPAKYAHIISEDVWRAFVAKRVEASFQKLSEANRKRALNPAYPYRKSRMGYARLEQKLLQEMRSKNKPPKTARVDKANVIDNENIQQETLSQSVSQGEKQDCGSQDILGKVFNVPEQPGRVRGVGFGVSIKDYFPPQKRQKRDNASEIQRLTDVVESLMRQVNDLENRLQMQNDVERQPNSRPSAIHSCMLTPSNLHVLPGKSKGKGKGLGSTKKSIAQPMKNQGKSVLQPSAAVRALSQSSSSDGSVSGSC